MADDNSDIDFAFLKSRGERSANTNMLGVRGVNPDNAAQALSQRGTGIPPAVGMVDPSVGKDIALSNQQQQVLGQSPALSQFTSQDPTRAAIVQDDLPNLDNVVKHLDPIKNFQDAFTPAYQDLIATAQKFAKQKPDGSYDYNLMEGWPGLGRGFRDVLGMVGAAWNPINEPLARLYNAVPLPAYSGVNLLNPFERPRLLNDEERLQQARSTVGLGMMFAGGPRGVGAAARATEAGAGESFFNNPFRKGPNGPQPSPSGLGSKPYEPSNPVGGEETPQTWDTHRQAARWGIDNPAPDGFRYEMYVSPEGKYGWDMVPTEPYVGTPPPGFSEETDALHQDLAKEQAKDHEALSEAIADTKTQERSPETMSALLEQENPGQMVSISEQHVWDTLSKTPGMYGDFLDAMYKGQASSAYDETGQNLQVPYSNYLAFTAGKPFEAELNAGATFPGGTLSSNDLNELKTPQGTSFIPVGELDRLYKSGQISGSMHEAVNLAHVGPLGADSISLPNKKLDEILSSAPPEQKSALQGIINYQTYSPDKALPDSVNEALQHLDPTLRTVAAQASKEVWLHALFENGKAAGLTDKQLEKYSGMLQQAQKDIYDRLVKRVAKKLELYKKPIFKAAYNKHYNQIQSTIMARPDVMAYHQLKYGDTKEVDLVKGNVLVQDGKPTTFYHGSNHYDIGTETNPVWKVPEFGNYPVISFAEDPKFFEHWGAGGGNYLGFNYIVHIKAKSVGDFRNPKDVDKAIAWYKKVNPQMSYESDSDFYHRVQNQRYSLENGSWGAWENTTMQDAIGWEATRMIEYNWQKDKPNINVHNGDLVYFKYRKDLVPTKTKLDIAARKNFDKELLARLPKGIFEEDGADPEEFAAHLGFDSADQMLRDIAELKDIHGPKKSLKQWLASEWNLRASHAAEQELGFNVSPEALLEEARQEVAVPQVEDLLIQSLRDLKEQLGDKVQLDIDAIRMKAADDFERLVVRDATDIKGITGRIISHASKAHNSLLAGKPQDLLDAFAHRQNQLMEQLKLRSAYKFKTTFDATQRNWTRLAGMETHPRIAQEFLNHIHYNLESMGFKLRRQSQELEESLGGISTRDFLDWVRGLMYEPAYADLPPDPTGKNFAASPKDMIVRDYREVRDMINGLRGIGTAFNHVFAENEARLLSEVGWDVWANALTLTPKGRYDIGGRIPPPKTLFGKVGRNFDRGLTNIANWQLRPETVFYYMDKDEFGPMLRYVFKPLLEGRYIEDELIKSVGKQINDFYKKAGKDWKASLRRPIDVPELQWRGRNMINTPGELIKLALNLGTLENFTKLVGGYSQGNNLGFMVNMGEALKHLRPIDQEFVQLIWDIHEQQLWPRIKQTYRDPAVSGVPPRKKTTRNFLLNGIEMRGGYFDIQYDPSELELMGAKDPTLRGIDSIMGGDYRSALSPNNYTKTVTGFVAPIDLDFENIERGLNQAIHDISFRKALIQANKVLQNENVAGAVQTLLGPDYNQSLRHYLEYVARQAVYAQSGSDKVAGFFRRRRADFVATEALFRVSTIITHSSIAASHMVGAGGNALSAASDLTLGALIDLTKTPAERDRWLAFVNARSKELKNLDFTIDRDLNETLRKITTDNDVQTNYKKLGMSIFTTFKAVEGRVTWLAVYRKYMAEFGPDREDEAIFLADKAIRDTQGSNTVVDLPPVLRGGLDAMGEVGRFATVFMGFRNTSFNREWSVAMGLRRVLAGGGTSRDWNMIRTVMFFTVIPALIVTYYNLKAHKEQDELGKALLKGFLESTVGASVMGDEAVDIGLGGLDAERHSPQAEMINSFTELGRLAFGQKVKYPVRDLFDAAGFMGLPSPDQAGITAQSAYDMQAGNYIPQDQMDAIRALGYGPGQKPKHGFGRNIGGRKIK